MKLLHLLEGCYELGDLPASKDKVRVIEPLDLLGDVREPFEGVKRGQGGYQFIRVSFLFTLVSAFSPLKYSPKEGH